MFEISLTANKLTNLERNELEFFMIEYGNEIERIKNSEFRIKNLQRRIENLEALVHNKKIKTDTSGFEYTEYNKSEKNYTYSLFEKDKFGRFRVFAYSDDRIQLFVNPILGFEFTIWDGNNSNYIWNGVSSYGSYGKNIGFSMDFRDNTESGEIQDSLHLFTPAQGLRKNGRGSFQYNVVNAQISYSWSNGSVSIGKTPFEWGYAENGKIVHSSKAPSYPNLRLDVKLSDWLSFNYLFGVLNSEVVDSNEVYGTFLENNRELFREKYFASHSLIVKPFKGLSFALGESIIISDRLELSYLIPVMFFRLADHYHSSHNNDAGNNAQFIFNISSWNHIPNTHLYSTLLIDEIITGKIFNSEKARNQLGYTFGVSVVDLPFQNSNLKVEYSHINPFAYKHYIPTLLYQNQGYDLGHWIGHNADILHLSYLQRFQRGVNFKVWAQYIRKGADGTADMMYKIPQPEFLFGLNTNYTYYGLAISYEFIHDLFLRGKYQYSSIKTEYNKGKFSDEDFSTFKLALFYGM